jgi:hypothetical protein
MEFENHKRQQKGLLLLECGAVFVISLILFPVSQSVKTVSATPITIMPNNTIEKSKTGVTNQVGKNGLIVNKNPIYQASGWSLGLTKLKSAGFPQEVELIFENGTVNGVGKVTNLEAWIFSPVGAHGLGHGVITTKDKQIISWNAHDISGTNNKNGTATYRGLIIFNDDNSTGKLAFFNNLKGIYVTEANGNNQTTKMWKLK